MLNVPWYDFGAYFEGQVWFFESVIVLLSTWLVYALWKRSVKASFTGLNQKNRQFIEVCLTATHNPVNTGIVVIGVMSCVMVPMFYHSEQLYALFLKIRSVSLLFIIAWSLMRVINLLDLKVVDGSFYVENKTRAMTLITGCRIMIAFSVFILAIQALGYSLSGLLAFSSVGAIIIGLASKTWIENLLGFATIRSNKKFAIGDVISIEEMEVQGVVESMSLSSTKIRDFNTRLVSVPNGRMLINHVSNISESTNRRVVLEFPLLTSQLAELNQTIRNIRKGLMKDERVEQDMRVICSVTHYDAHGGYLVLVIDCYLKCVQLEQFHAERQDIVFMVLEVLEKMGVKLALRQVNNVENQTKSGLSVSELLGSESKEL